MFDSNIRLTRSEILWLSVVFWAVAFTAFEAPYSFVFKTALHYWQVWADAIISLIFLIDIIYQIKHYKKINNFFQHTQI